MRPLLLLFVAISFSLVSSYAATISGKVVKAGEEPIPAANIILIQASTNKLAKADVANDDGSFVLSGLIADTYVLKVTAIGYTDNGPDTIVLGDSDITLPDIVMKETTGTLKEVTVSAQKPLIEIKADKLVVNIENSIINTGSSVFEALGRSPGVMIDQSDNINLKGRPGVTVMMNGKIMPVGGSDLASILKGMPSSAIEKIEIITNPGARYDAAGSGGIINIVTKKDKNKGINGTLNATYGQGVYRKINAGTNLNYRDSKWNVNLNYNHADRQGFGHLDITRQFFVNGQQTTQYTQSNNTFYPVKNHSGSFAVDRTFSANTSVGASFTGNNSRFKPLGDNTSRVDSSNMVTYFTTTNHSQDEWSNYSVNGYAKHKFDTLGRELSMDLDYARYWNQTYQLYTTSYRDANDVPFLPNNLLYGDLSGTTQIRSVKVDHTHPLKNGLRIDAGLKSSYVTADNEPLFYARSNSGVDILDTSKSNHFVYNENINAAYLNASKDWKKWSTQLGLRCEQTIAKGDQKITDQQFTRRYAQLFPSLAVQWHTNKNNDLGITLSRRIDRPGYNQLNPFKYFLDLTNYRMGNPYLNPTLSYGVELTHTYKQRFITTFLVSHTTNVITETLEADETFPNISKQTDKNLASMDFYGISVAYPIQICKWWQNTMNLNSYYGFFKGTLSNTPLNRGGAGFDVNSTNSFTISKTISAELSIFYRTPLWYGYYDMIAVWNANAGIQKKVLKTKGTVKLGITDMFWTDRPGATIEFANFHEVWKSRRDSRVANLTFVYRFGRNTSNAQRHNSGADDEKRRVGNSG